MQWRCASGVLDSAGDYIAMRCSPPGEMESATRTSSSFQHLYITGHLVDRLPVLTSKRYVVRELLFCEDSVSADAIHMHMVADIGTFPSMNPL